MNSTSSTAMVKCAMLRLISTFGKVKLLGIKVPYLTRRMNVVQTCSTTTSGKLHPLLFVQMIQEAILNLIYSIKTFQRMHGTIAR